MPRAPRRPREFYLVVVDDDRRVFNVLGPMVSDLELNKKVSELQESGRKVRSFASDAARRQDEVSQDYARQTGYSYSTEPILGRVEEAGSAYSGPLPKYATHANRRRLVQLLCKGAHPHTAWAEMNADYPGQDVLQRSQVGDFTATCLRCGRVAQDAYNWFR